MIHFSIGSLSKTCLFVCFFKCQSVRFKLLVGSKLKREVGSVEQCYSDFENGIMSSGVTRQYSEKMLPFNCLL